MCLLLAWIHISEANVDQISGRQERLHPGKSRNLWHLQVTKNITALSLDVLTDKAYQIFLETNGKKVIYKYYLLWDKGIKVMSEIAQYQHIFCAWMLITLFCRSLSKNATDCPWRFPEGEVRGVLISAWASTQIRHRSGHCWAWPSTEPIARLWEWNHHKFCHKRSVALLILAFNIPNSTVWDYFFFFKTSFDWKILASISWKCKQLSATKRKTLTF